MLAVDHHLLTQRQYGLSPNLNNIQPSSYFQNTHPNSRAAHGDARAARPNPSVDRVRRGDGPPPPPRRPASAPLPEPTAPNAAMIQRQPSQYSNYNYGMPDQQRDWTAPVAATARPPSGLPRMSHVQVQQHVQDVADVAGGDPTTSHPDLTRPSLRPSTITSSLHALWKRWWDLAWTRRTGPRRTTSKRVMTRRSSSQWRLELMIILSYI